MEPLTLRDPRRNMTVRMVVIAIAILFPILVFSNQKIKLSSTRNISGKKT